MNRLARESSPYLLQHAENPVEWYPWGEEALARARAEQRPILLSVGYSACHWCHVMAHESFEDAETAALMNELFVNVKVDREERPDVDAVYMNAVVGLTGHGGWPMTVFLTPQGEPFYGGTYYPPEPRMGMPAFRQVLQAVADAWQNRRAEVSRAAGEVSEALRRSADLRPSDDPLSNELLEGVLAPLRSVYDARSGGFGGAPKFPPGPAIGLLFRLHVRTGAPEALEMARGTLDGMALGGMYDVLGGGFHRYSVDDRWLVPHFEKMLYDNALLATAYLQGHAATGEERYRSVAEATLDYLLREMQLPEGGFASAQDADTDGEEGLTYVWTPGQLREVLGADAETAIAYYGVTEQGNFEHGRTVLRPSGPEPPNLQELRARLLAARDRRQQPGRDDKALAAWNGLALAAFAEGGWRLERADYTAAALACAEFLLGRMSDAEGRLLRTFRGGTAKIAAYLEDYAAVAHGLVELHLATADPRWLGEARRLARLAVELFADEANGGFFFTAADAEQLVARHKELDDNPTPSGNALLAFTLLRLARIYGEADLEPLAAGAIRLGAQHVRRAPHAFGQLLSALDLYLSPPREVAVVGDDEAGATRLRRAVLAGFHPNVVYAFGPAGDGHGVALLEGRGLVGGRAAAYVCERFACRAPVTEPDEAAAALAG